MPARITPVVEEIRANDLSGIPFPAEDVHVWLIPVGAGNRETLTAAEQALAARFHQEADAHRFTTGRSALRRLIAAYLDLNAAEVQIGGGRNEKPFISGPAGRNLQFNLSHSGKLVLIAFHARAVGIDLEHIDPSFDPADLLPEHFSQTEQAAVSGAPDRLAAFYCLWTRKEAIVKARGTGLGPSLAAIPVLTDQPGQDQAEGEEQLLCFSFDPAPGYAAALACNVSTRNIVYYRAI